jgi:hypothetical protein
VWSVYDQPEPRRAGPLLLVVLLVLGGVGGTMGYLVTRQVLANNAAAPPGVTSTTTPGATGGGTTPGRGIATPKASTSTSTKDESTFCPDVTVKAMTDAGLNGKLTLLLYIEVTIPRGKARGWICRNEAGVIVYQGHELSGPLDKANNGQNTIILVKGIKGEVVVDGDGYKATNPVDDGNKTDYLIAKNRFKIVQSAGGTTTGSVTRFYTP